MPPKNDNIEFGSKITYIFQLNDIKAGGGYAFPKLRLHTPAEEVSETLISNSVVFFSMYAPCIVTFSFKGNILFWQFKSRLGPVHNRLREYVQCPPRIGSQYGMLCVLR